ncbi:MULTISPECIES: hypothetical protein [Erwiniaceae]|uniref:Uncharacterized protein n=1 Tax=Pantoea coffeiphila TaxID=1465635 RepID=A0A2S9I499_9GAMM|nr:MULTISPECIES: hypothetical protein [Erwiniaceae]MBM7341475.1 hypothetical protein [Pantoea coffeiphila]PRD12534.1 hypothetical protein CQW29_25900 [Pantoea coffeiphila]
MSRHSTQAIETNALNVDEARNFIKSGGERVRLAWDISSDEFFRIASASGREGMRMVKKGRDFFLERMPG